MEKQCVNYVGPTCVDGGCPMAQRDGFPCPGAADCENCFYYGGCADCALACTEHCEKEVYPDSKE